jgi:signal transduction histidine kinase
VVTNLLDNAIKFTPLCKRIWVNLKTSEDYATVIVEDEGIGVPIDERDYIFDPFYRSSNAPQEETGVGLGLYISKRLAGLLGGDLVAVERPQGGTIVEFSLPLEPGRNTASTR